MNKDKLGIYIHIPFCHSKCQYCGFLSEPIDDLSMISAYVPLVCKELELYGQERFAKIPYKKNKTDAPSTDKKVGDRTVDTVFFGGGTPSLLTGDQIAAVMDQIRESFTLEEGAEVTMEANPESLTEENLKGYKAAGVNRLSIGLQAAQEPILKKLGRIHDLATFKKAYEMAVKAGFENINVDVMFGLPDQTEEDWEETLAVLLGLHPQPTHISCYSLQIEEETPFYSMYKEGLIDLPPYEVDRRMYKTACDKLEGAGYHRYEISNFAKEGFESRHNLKYWNMDDFIGVGLGASSFFGGYRYKDMQDLFMWNRLLVGGRLPVKQEDTIIPVFAMDPMLEKEGMADSISTFVFTGLRKAEGIAFADFEERFEKTFDEIYEKAKETIAAHIDEGRLVRTEERLYLTLDGIAVSNDIMADLLIEQEDLPEDEEGDKK